MATEFNPEDFKRTWDGYTKIRVIIPKTTHELDKGFLVVLFGHPDQKTSVYRLGVIKGNEPFGEIQFRKKVLNSHPILKRWIVIRERSGFGEYHFSFMPRPAIAPTDKKEVVVSPPVKGEAPSYNGANIFVPKIGAARSASTNSNANQLNTTLHAEKDYEQEMSSCPSKTRLYDTSKGTKGAADAFPEFGKESMQVGASSMGVAKAGGISRRFRGDSPQEDDIIVAAPPQPQQANRLSVGPKASRSSFASPFEGDTDVSTILDKDLIYDEEDVYSPRFLSLPLEEQVAHLRRAVEVRDQRLYSVEAALEKVLKFFKQ